MEIIVKDFNTLETLKQYDIKYEDDRLIIFVNIEKEQENESN